eukprot:2388697-Alexandrium_andersonii.AAC.1
MKHSRPRRSSDKEWVCTCMHAVFRHRTTLQTLSARTRYAHNTVSTSRRMAVGMAMCSTTHCMQDMRHYQREGVHCSRKQHMLSTGMADNCREGTQALALERKPRHHQAQHEDDPEPHLQRVNRCTWSEECAAQS